MVTPSALRGLNNRVKEVHTSRTSKTGENLQASFGSNSGPPSDKRFRAIRIEENANAFRPRAIR